MTGLTYGMLGLLLTVVRSTLALQLGDAGGQVFDLNIPLIVALGSSGLLKHRLPVVFLIGFWADSLSIAPFGFYITLYGWFFMAIRGLGMLIQITQRLVILLVIIAGVLFEYLSGVLFVQNFPDTVQFSLLGWRLLWAVIFGPIVVMIALYLEKQLQRQMNKMMPVD